MHFSPSVEALEEEKSELKKWKEKALKLEEEVRRMEIREK